jgi:hypothetical protein
VTIISERPTSGTLWDIVAGNLIYTNGFPAWEQLGCHRFPRNRCSLCPVLNFEQHTRKKEHEWAY